MRPFSFAAVFLVSLVVLTLVWVVAQLVGIRMSFFTSIFVTAALTVVINLILGDIFRRTRWRYW